MKTTKQKKLEKAGWIIGSSTDFLKLSKAEDAIVTMKMALASELRDLRKEQHLTQQELAKQIGSSQSRVAKMEVADKSVSIELFIRSLVSLGASSKQIGLAISSDRIDVTQKKSSSKQRLTA